MESQHHTSLKFLPQHLNDQEKLVVYKKGLEWEVDMSDEFSRFQFWDNLSILAFYQNDKETACKAYKKMLQLNAIPENHLDRIYRNACYYDDLEDLSYEVFQTHLNSLSLFSISEHPPKQLYFIFLNGGYEFGFHHYLAIRSAQQKMKWDKIILFYDCKPNNNPWWKKVESLKGIECQVIYPPKHINRQEIKYKQHQADIIRLHILYRFGGVYLDLDMCTYKDFTELFEMCNLTHPIVLCRESFDKLVNAFIMALPHTQFIEKWIKEYESEYGNVEDWWAGLSVRTPHELATKYNCVILSQESFLPFDYMHTDFFTSPNSSIDFSKSFGIHLWDTENQKRKLLPNDPIEFKSNNSFFYQCFSDIVQEDFESYMNTFLIDYCKKVEQEVEEVKKNKNELEKKIKELEDRILYLEMKDTSIVANKSGSNTLNNSFNGLNSLNSLNNINMSSFNNIDWSKCYENIDWKKIN